MRVSALQEHYRAALPLLPAERQRNARHRSLHLDDLLDAGAQKLSSGSRDLIYTAYRFHHAYQYFAPQFFKKHVKSAPFQDLALLGFSTLLSRDRIPGEVLSSELIETAKALLPKALIGVLNAFCRWVLARRSELLAELESDSRILLGPALQRRWQSSPELLQEAGRRLLSRPTGGVWAFDRRRDFRLWDALEFFEAKSQAQAMNPGSKAWMDYVDRSSEGAGTISTYLDTCSAPGGKLIWESLRLLEKSSELQIHAIEEKFPRMEILRSNLQKFDLTSKVQCHLLSLGVDSLPSEISTPTWDLVSADLPCTGSGTLASRPDILSEDLGDRLQSLKGVQEKIIRSLLSLKYRHLFVSICSIDPEEIAHISAILGAKSTFQSWQVSTDPVADGITGWLL